MSVYTEAAGQVLLSYAVSRFCSQKMALLLKEKPVAGVKVAAYVCSLMKVIAIMQILI